MNSFSFLAEDMPGHCMHIKPATTSRKESLMCLPAKVGRLPLYLTIRVLGLDVPPLPPALVSWAANTLLLKAWQAISDVQLRQSTSI
jgi:hypothetical protein